MKTFLLAIVAVLLSLNVFGQALIVEGDPFASCSMCNGCAKLDDGQTTLSRIVVTSRNLTIDQLDVNGDVVVSKIDDVKSGKKTIEIKPYPGQIIYFYADQCPQPLEVEVSEFVGGGVEYAMQIVYDKDIPVVSVVNVDPEPPSIKTPPFSITSCIVYNIDNNGKTLPLDNAHMQYLTPEISYNCNSAGSYDIYVKVFDPDDNLCMVSGSPSGYSQVNRSVSLSSGSGSRKLTGLGQNSSGKWRAGNYRCEFYYDGELLYACRIPIPEGEPDPIPSSLTEDDPDEPMPFTITSCDVANADSDDEPQPLDAAHTQYLSPIINYTCNTTGSYDIYVKFFDAEGSLRKRSGAPSGYSYVHSDVSLPAGSGSRELAALGRNIPGYWRAGDYRYEFYYNGKCIYTHKFTIPEG